MRYLFLALAPVLSVLFTACSSVDNDAKKAAKLHIESVEYIQKNDLEGAEKLFQKSQQIIDKYKNSTDTAEYSEFSKKYMLYLNGDKEENN